MSAAALIPTEHQSQMAFVQWLKIKNIRFYSIPNSLKVGGVKLMAYLKAEGLSAGVPDLCIPYETATANGLYVEMKKKGGRVRPEQTEWHEFLVTQRYTVAVCYSADEAIETTLRYFNGAVNREKA